MSAERDRRDIDDVTTAFFDAFTMQDGNAPNIDVLYDVFLPSARIVKAVGGAIEELDVRAFVEPRRELLASGVFERFEEHETSGKTDLFGNIGQRFCRYEKSWRVSGAQQGGSGAKSLQFVRTPAGWKIAAVVWDDDV